MKAPPVTRKNAQTLTIKLNPNASEMYSKLLVEGSPPALAGAVLATCVAAKAKNKNRKVPTNSPIPNTRYVRMGCDMLAKGAMTPLDCLPTAVDVLDECEWEWERVYCLVGLSGAGKGVIETETGWLGPPARPAFSFSDEGEGKGDDDGLDSRRVGEGTGEDGRNVGFCEGGGGGLEEARGVLFISTTETVVDETGAWAPIVSAFSVRSGSVLCVPRTWVLFDQQSVVSVCVPG